MISEYNKLKIIERKLLTNASLPLLITEQGSKNAQHIIDYSNMNWLKTLHNISSVSKKSFITLKRFNQLCKLNEVHILHTSSIYYMDLLILMEQIDIPQSVVKHDFYAGSGSEKTLEIDPHIAPPERITWFSHLVKQMRFAIRFDSVKKFDANHVQDKYFKWIDWTSEDKHLRHIATLIDGDTFYLLYNDELYSLPIATNSPIEITLVPQLTKHLNKYWTKWLFKWYRAKSITIWKDELPMITLP